jgi:hypothetical protein
VRLTALFPVCACVLLLSACGPSTPPEPPKKAAPAHPKPVDQSRRFPAANRAEVTVVEASLYGKDFLPGGNIAKYKRGAREYEMFLIRAANAASAATLLFDFKTQLAGSKFIAHFGGYFGDDAGTPTFLFSKGSWLAGVRGLSEADADTAARDFAARLDFD